MVKFEAIVGMVDILKLFMGFGLPLRIVLGLPIRVPDHRHLLISLAHLFK
jgi:hypothetical protein